MLRSVPSISDLSSWPKYTRTSAAEAAMMLFHTPIIGKPTLNHDEDLNAVPLAEVTGPERVELLAPDPASIYLWRKVYEPHVEDFFREGNVERN